MAGSDSTAILIFAHGSSLEEANRAVHELADQVAVLGHYRHVRATFLGQAQPDLEEAVARAVEAGARRVIVIPYFLSLGVHLQRDLPDLIASLRQKHPEVTIQVSQPLEGHPLMASIILDRVQEVLPATEAIP